MKILFSLLFLMNSAYALNLNQQLRSYPEWLGINSPTLFCQCPQISGLAAQSSCGAPLKSKAEKLIPHYIFPIDTIAQKFPEYLNGNNKCFSAGKSFRGLECVELMNPIFKEIQSDLHNLTLIESSVQKVLENKTLNIVNQGKSLGACPFTYNKEFYQIKSLYQGWIARSYLYLDSEYSELNLLDTRTKNLAEKISKEFPPTPQECRVTDHINKIQNRKNNKTIGQCSLIKRISK